MRKLINYLQWWGHVTLKIWNITISAWLLRDCLFLKIYNISITYFQNSFFQFVKSGLLTYTVQFQLNQSKGFAKRRLKYSETTKWQKRRLESRNTDFYFKNGKITELIHVQLSNNFIMINYYKLGQKNQQNTHLNSLTKQNLKIPLKNNKIQKKFNAC